MDTAVCAFCFEQVRPGQPGSLFIVVGSERDPARQELFAHAQCLAERLHPQTPFDATSFEPPD
jgi:hypothetical protein